MSVLLISTLSLFLFLQDSDMGNGKLGNESYSGNDDGSDDNQQGSTNNDDLNVSSSHSLTLPFVNLLFPVILLQESHDSLPSKRSKSGKDQRMAQQDDNSTSGELWHPFPSFHYRLHAPIIQNIHLSILTTNKNYR